MKRQPMILSGILGGAAAILALVTMDYVSESFSLLLAVLTYFFFSILEDILKLSQFVTKKYFQA
jgi:hypothetical protein